MRILFSLINFPPSNFGGIASCMYPVIKEIAQIENHNLKVITSSYKIPSDKLPETNAWITYNGIAVNYIETASPSFSVKIIYEGIQQLKLCDQVYLNSFFYLPNLFFLVAALLYKKKIYLLPHGELFAPTLKSKYWKKLPYLLFIKTLSKNIHFISTAEQEAKQIRTIFKNAKTTVIPNFFDLKPPLKMGKLNQFLFLGRICTIKKIENLLLACSLSKHFLANNYRLLIAGPTDKEFLNYEHHLKNLVLSYGLEKNIQFLGEVLSPAKEELLSKSKALFVVSDSENFSNVVVESLAQGTPVVASLGTPWENLIEKNAGYWIDNSAASIALKIDNFILMSNENYKIMSANAIDFSQEFSKNKIMPLWLKLIQ